MLEYSVTGRPFTEVFGESQSGDGSVSVRALVDGEKAVLVRTEPKATPQETFESVRSQIAAEYASGNWYQLGGTYAKNQAGQWCDAKTGEVIHREPIIV